MFDVWERYKDLVRLCPFHGLEKWIIIHTFYNGLLYSTRMTLDVTFGGALTNSTKDIGYKLIEETAKNHHSMGSVRQVAIKSTPKIGCLYEVNMFDRMSVIPFTKI